MLLDVNLPGVSGLEFLREMETAADESPLVIIITAHGSERLAVEAVKAGAYDYLAKPFELDDLRLVVKNAAETLSLRRENLSLRQRIETERAQRGALLGNSPGCSACGTSSRKLQRLMLPFWCEASRVPAS